MWQKEEVANLIITSSVIQSTYKRKGVMRFMVKRITSLTDESIFVIVQKFDKLRRRINRHGSASIIL